MPSLHFLFHEPVSVFKILLNFSSGLIYLVQDISHAHLFLRFQQGSCKRLPSFSRENSHCKDNSLAERFLCSPVTLVHHSVPGTIKGETSLPGFHISIKKNICDPEDLSQRHLVITEVLCS